MSNKLFHGEYKPPPAPEAGKFIFRRKDPTTGADRAPMVLGLEELIALVEEGQRMLDEYTGAGDGSSAT